MTCATYGKLAAVSLLGVCLLPYGTPRVCVPKKHNGGAICFVTCTGGFGTRVVLRGAAEWLSHASSHDSVRNDIEKVSKKSVIFLVFFSHRTNSIVALEYTIGRYAQTP